MRRRIAFVAFLGWAGTPDAGLEAQTIVAPSGRTLFRGATLIRSTMEVHHSSVQTDGEAVEVTEYVPSLAVAYGFYPKWTVIAAQPFVSVDAAAREGDRAQRVNANGFEYFVSDRLLLELSLPIPVYGSSLTWSRI